MAETASLFSVLPPLSIYIHLPWCERKCPYCDFNSHAFRGELPVAEYVDALLKDLEYHIPEIWGRRLISVFIGGGTPSLFSAASINRLISGIRSRIPCVPNIEITLEANPGSCEADRFKGFLDAGVNRLSIGVQSFQGRQLKALGRIHDRKQAFTSVAIAHTAGFENINIDLMYALPGQTVTEAAKDVETAISQSPHHISCYQLTIEPDTYFYHHPPSLPSDDEKWEIQLAIQSLLNEARYYQYEISAYAKPDRQCKHNLNYWQFGDYIGIGAGAHSKISFSNRVIRTQKVSNPNTYMKLVSTSDQIVEVQELSNEDVRFEFLLNALRLKNGFSTSLLRHRTGQSLEKLMADFDQLQREGLLRFDKLHVRTTERGYRYLDDVLQRLLPHSAITAV